MKLDDAQHVELANHPAWDRVDGRNWAGATRSEMIDVVLEALADVVGDETP